MKIPKVSLIQVDLTQAKGHECPGIKAGSTEYLILHDGQFHAGTFGREWYGLNFNGVYDAGLQFDAPGSNGSDWQAVWRIKKS